VRVVCDTNVLIAAFVARGVCHELLEHCERLHELVTSEFILREFEEKLLTKFRVPPLSASEAVTMLRSRFEVVQEVALEAPVSRDPDDDWILSVAVVGNCACIVTGDRDLLDLKEHRGIPIIVPGSFWRFESPRPA
jgi:putative PIN family toxin of toxin-antitoxin system